MKGFTLVETLVAISLLSFSIVAPMLLTVQSLSSAYYSRDEITAYYLAQEGIEEVHQIRDGQILQIAETSNSSGINLFGPIPLNQDFTIDARQSNPQDAITECSLEPGGVCLPLETDGTLYGYYSPTLDNCSGLGGSGWTCTNFTRTLHASFVGGNQDELRVQVTITWHTGAYSTRSFSLSEDLYRWVQDGSAA
jgi:prepilin-type N-terminal cleavage/methylation domain-containing protein